MVNNAGIYPYDLFDDMSFAPWRDVFAIDLDGPFLMCKAFVSMMRVRKWVGVVNVSSVEWWLVNPRQTALPLPVEGHLPGGGPQVGGAFARQRSAVERAGHQHPASGRLAGARQPG